MRYLLAVLILAAGAAAGVLGYRHLNAGPPVVLPLPRQLSVSRQGGTPLLPGGWTNSSSVVLAARAAGNLTAGEDVEVQPATEKFTDTPTATSASPGCPSNANCASSDPLVTVHLADGDYHWQARLHNQRGISPWMAYGGIIRIDTRPPATPLIISPTDPNPRKTYHRSTLRFDWHTSDDASGVAGFSYRLDTDPRGEARTEIRTGATGVTLQGLDTGRYFFHLRAVDVAGNWGPTSTFPVHIDVTPPGLAYVRFSRFQFDPQVAPLTVSFALTRPARTLRVGVYQQSTGNLVRLYTLSHLVKRQMLSVTWHGRDDAGRSVGPGLYEIYIRAIDRYGHSSLSGWRDFVVNYRRIVVSLGQQRLWAYDGSRVLRTSLVTTGNRALPTPTGTFSIMGKFHPFTFHSPWPKSNRFYYPPSKVQYAMLFQEGGYFIHDAPWRSAFGPGTNTQLGTPGQNYTGTHGCVNVPPDVAQWLYTWTQIGTVVQVIP